MIAEAVSTPMEATDQRRRQHDVHESVAGISHGVLQMTITFPPGTDPDTAQVQVQNRVSSGAHNAAVKKSVSLGVTTQKQSPTFLVMVQLLSPDGKYDALYLRNYANIKVKDDLALLAWRRPGADFRQWRLCNAHLA